uniref:Uncharacterized protein n=1 Tax=Arundo donax TaxID=35708 RepID=A0A0A9H7Q3_ARUDO
MMRKDHYSMYRHDIAIQLHWSMQIFFRKKKLRRLQFSRKITTFPSW